ncbi:ABC transporter substrate-binding protein [Actinokineospora sp. NPDC004072]
MSLRIGVVVPRSGRLVRLGEPLEFVARRCGRWRGVRVFTADSRSTVAGARRAVRRLARERVGVVVALGGSAVLPAVVEECARRGVPSLTTTLPWQLHPGSGFHFAWGLDDIARAFAEMWGQVARRPVVAGLWNDGVQGDALRRVFLPACGHPVLHEPAYPEGARDFSAQVEAFRGADVVTSAATGADLAAYLAQADPPRLVTCSRWLTYPFGRQDGIATIAYWTPHHPYVSSVDGTTAAELARDYQAATGRPWLQPLGLAHALFEVAVHAARTAADPADPGAIAQAIGRTRLDTVAGPLDWPGGPAPGVARVALAGGQWRGDDLVVVANSGAPDAPVGGDLVSRPR